MGKVRQPLDFYETPDEYTDTLLNALPNLTGQTIVSPCAGKGAIVQRIMQRYPAVTIITNDIDRSQPTDMHYDATHNEQLWQRVDGADWVIENPPFTPELMTKIIACALGAADNVVMLARLSFLEPTESRRVWWDGRKPDMCIVLPRYSFGLNSKGKRGNDSVTCCWLGWGQDVPQVFDIELAKPSWRRR